MNDTSANGVPSQRQIRHKRLRVTSWMAVIIALLGFPIALYLYSWATIACGGAFGESKVCELFFSMPWIGFALSLGAYLFVVWIINELGFDYYSETINETSTSRYAWKHAKQGYKGLDKGYHRHVRRVHRVASVALAGLAAYVSFMFFEADTLVNLGVASIAFVIGELFNWKRYSKLMKENGINV